MNSASKWKLVIVALVAVTLAWAGQSIARTQQGAPAKKAEQSKEEKAKAHAARIALFKKLFPTAKTSLAAAVTATEKESKGRAHSVEYTLTKEDKLTIEVQLIVDDKNVEYYVDPDSGKATVAKHEEGEEEEEEEEEGGK